MSKKPKSSRHSYKLEPLKAKADRPAAIEFEADNPSAALERLDHEAWEDRPVVVYEDDEPLGTIEHTRSGFWTVSATDDQTPSTKRRAKQPKPKSSSPKE